MLNAIEVSEMYKTFEKGNEKIEAVKGISLVIQKGKLFGFLGPNGAGKTTCLKIMVGLLSPTKGRIKILDQDPEKRSQELFIKIGIIPQDISIYQELTVEENLKFMASAYKIDKETATNRIDNLISKIGLEPKRKSRAKNLSGGQQRRLNLIMSLIHDPELIFCDEPTPGLDPQSRVVVWEFIQNLTKIEKKTVVLTTHFMEEADRLCDDVAIIDNGKILVCDKPEELKSSIGAGDLLEIKISDISKIDEVITLLKNFEGVQDIRTSSDTLLIRCLDVVPKISRILNIIEKTRVSITNMSIRNTTLEDVFIHLTGRELRN